MDRKLTRSPLSRPTALATAWVMLAMTALLVTLGALQDAASRASSPEAVVRQYFQALEAGDAEGALVQIQPTARAAARPFVQNNVRNKYVIAGIAAQQPSLLARLRGQGDAGQSVTVFLDITQAVGGEQWQASPQVPLVEARGRWYLSRAPLDIGS
ncbi:MAG TPA: hypothetical protein VGK54_14585 [Chloroflexota bacterium]|jgi:hypothetical protein